MKFARSSVVAVLAVLLLAGNGECENVETCTPTRVEIEHRASAYAVRVLSGDQPLRGRSVEVQAVDRDRTRFAREVELDDDGEASVTVPPDDLAAAEQVVANFAGDRTFCAGVDGTDEGTGGGS